MSNGQGFLLISKFVHLKFQKDQGDIIRMSKFQQNY